MSPCGQEYHALRRAFEERHAELGFQPVHGAREGRLADVQTGRCTGEVAFLGHGHEILELSDAHGTAILARKEARRALREARDTQ